MRLSLRAVLFLFILVLSTSCQDDDPDPVAPTPTGDPPETLARAERLYEDENGVHYRGLLVNAGSDVVAVEWRLEMVPEVQSGAVLLRDVAWTRAEGTEFEFVIPPASVGSDRWVLFVRAVSAEGVADASPVQISFGPDSVAPEIRIEEPGPFQSSACISTNSIIDLSWSVTDPDTTGGPIVVRYVVVDVGGQDGVCLTESDYEAQQPIAQLAPDDPRWSDWALYDTEADTWDPSRSVRLTELELYHSYLVALQARDASGATTSTFQWNQNVLHARISGTKFPILTVTGDPFGVSRYLSDAQVEDYSVLDRAPVSFSWEGDASSYAGRVVAYRFGWDLNDPADSTDEGWSGPSSTYTRSDTRTLEPGPHNFVVECRDNSGSLSRAVIEIQSIATPPRSQQRDLLFVDDWPVLGPADAQLEMLWDQQWEQMLTNIVADFDPSLDVIDAQREGDEITLTRLANYKSIIWFGNASPSSYMQRAYVPVSLDRTRYNLLQLVQKWSANLLLVGPGVGSGAIPQQRVFPVWFLDGPSPYPTIPPGQVDWPNGEELWVAEGFCARALSVVRPTRGEIYGESPTVLERTSTCDALARATVSPAFEAAVGTTTLLELRPNQDRLELTPGFRFDGEEFYDRNASDFAMEVVPRDCAVPMFVFNSRLTEGLADPEVDCGEKLYSLDGAAVGILSRAHADTKPLPGTYDFLWGFNPMGFEAEDVEAALSWVIREGWSIR